MLPNSIERTTPILGYNPYAFIMGEKSNYSHNVTNSIKNKDSLDYFAKNPEDMYANGEKTKKGFRITPLLKGIVSLGVVLLGTIGLIKGGGKLKNVKLTNAARNSAPSAGSTASSGFCGKVLGGLTKAKDAVVNSTKKFGGFVSNKFHTADTWIRGKFHKP